MYTYKSTGTTKAQNFTLTLDLIDPEDGTVTHLRTFTNEDTHSCSAYIQGAGGNIDDVNMIFADDYSKLAATVYMEDGSRHVGWMNEDGSFTDVSAMVTESSDFGALTDHRDPVFWNGYIYWRDYTNDDEDPDILRAPIESLTPGSVETMLENEQWNGTDLYPMEDGTVTDEMRCYDSYDSSFTHGAPIGHIGDWLDEDTCVRASDGKIFVSDVISFSGKEDMLGTALMTEWFVSDVQLTPNVSGRSCWNPVIAPDGSTVAFLSALDEGNEAPSLFTVPISGGEPSKVSTNYTFSSEMLVMRGNSSNPSCSFIVDWLE